MIRWLYKYIFRGIGIVFVVGVLTMLYLAVVSQVDRPAQNAPDAPARVGR